MRFALLLGAIVALSLATSLRSLAQAKTYSGFDANDYPGDALLPTLHKQFAFTGYWLNSPPGADHNPWAGKRSILVKNGFGFLVLFNGRLDNEIRTAAKSGKTPAAFGRADAASAVAAAHREGFPPGTVIFLDQEQGGRMLEEQGAYLLAWTEAVALGNYRPGVYASGQPVNEGKDDRGRPVTITTIRDIRQQIAAKHLHPVAFWVAQDACPPAPGCVVKTNPPAPDISGTLQAAAWQYAQSPRRKEFTRACGATYKDGNCYTPGLTSYALDLSSSTSPDPSQGR
ncbi:MAG TPA: glycoside hydrolase domain-containing protein [Acidobacteriaceae bacterium]|jgi:hypothetical protein|nr:glycoside hydrolase domain-containing protein [Acidobacteriaceae bacterium]